MIVFFSYSISEYDQYLISSILDCFYKTGIHVRSGYYTDRADRQNPKQVSLVPGSDWFIGFVTSGSENRKEVLKELHIAHENKIPSLLILEKGIHKVSFDLDSKISEIIYFDRNNLTSTIDFIQSKIDKVGKFSVVTTPQSEYKWFFGGLALLGFFQLVSMLNEKQKPKKSSAAKRLSISKSTSKSYKFGKSSAGKRAASYKKRSIKS